MRSPSSLSANMHSLRFGLLVLLLLAAVTGAFSEELTLTSSLDTASTGPSATPGFNTQASPTTVEQTRPGTTAYIASYPSGTSDSSATADSITSSAQSSLAASSAVSSTSAAASSSTPSSAAATSPLTTARETVAPATSNPSAAPHSTGSPAASSAPGPFTSTAFAPPASTSTTNHSASTCAFDNVESEFCVGSSINLVPSVACFAPTKRFAHSSNASSKVYPICNSCLQASAASSKLSGTCMTLTGVPAVSITRDSADIENKIAFLFRDDKSITEEGCWNYAALVGSSVTLSLALLVTCIIAFIVWRRRRANTSSGNRNRLPSISLPSLGRSRTPRFNKLVHADEQQFLMGSSAFSPSSV